MSDGTMRDQIREVLKSVENCFVGGYLILDRAETEDLFLKIMHQTLSEHGDEREVRTNGGSQTVKFCVKHGWIDLEMIGGIIVWHRKHRNCQPLIIWNDEPKKAA